MKLRGSIVSPCVARVLMFARTRGIDLMPEPARAGGHELPVDREHNPFGEIPALEAGGRFLAATEAICAYLETAYQELMRPRPEARSGS